MTTADLLTRFNGVQARGTGKWSSRCPGHPDTNPSLSIAEGDRGLLLKCWAGCTLDAITSALGIRVADLFFDAPTTHGHRPTPKPGRIDRIALPFQFELAALDRRLRAKRVKQAIQNISLNELTDNDLDRLMGAVGRTYADLERAELLEAVADDVRFQAFKQRERMVRHAA